MLTIEKSGPEDILTLSRSDVYNHLLDAYDSAQSHSQFNEIVLWVLEYYHKHKNAPGHQYTRGPYLVDKQSGICLQKCNGQSRFDFPLADAFTHFPVDYSYLRTLTAQIPGSSPLSRLAHHIHRTHYGKYGKCAIELSPFCVADRTSIGGDFVYGPLPQKDQYSLSFINSPIYRTANDNKFTKKRRYKIKKARESFDQKGWTTEVTDGEVDHENLFFCNPAILGAAFDESIARFGSMLRARWTDDEDYAYAHLQLVLWTSVALSFLFSGNLDLRIVPGYMTVRDAEGRAIGHCLYLRYRTYAGGVHGYPTGEQMMYTLQTICYDPDLAASCPGGVGAEFLSVFIRDVIDVAPGRLFNPTCRPHHTTLESDVYKRLIVNTDMQFASLSVLPSSAVGYEPPYFKYVDSGHGLHLTTPPQIGPAIFYEGVK